jgi:hypothetical protein
MSLSSQVLIKVLHLPKKFVRSAEILFREAGLPRNALKRKHVTSSNVDTIKFIKKIEDGVSVAKMAKGASKAKQCLELALVIKNRIQSGTPTTAMYLAQVIKLQVPDQSRAMTLLTLAATQIGFSDVTCSRTTSEGHELIYTP